MRVIGYKDAFLAERRQKTVFGQQKKKGVFKELPESIQSQKFSFTRNLLAEKGFEAYETSNFAKNQQYSKHNTSYWNQESYLGIGPSAHSFNQVSRQWNVAKNGVYTKAINEGSIPAEIEILTEANKINEYMMTRLRTKWGIECSKIITRRSFWCFENYLPRKSIEYFQGFEWGIYRSKSGLGIFFSSRYCKRQPILWRRQWTGCKCSKSTRWIIG